MAEVVPLGETQVTVNEAGAQEPDEKGIDFARWRRIRLVWDIVACVILVGLGTEFHFIYEQASKPVWAAWFMPIDETPFSHWKLVWIWWLINWILQLLNDMRIRKKFGLSNKIMDFVNDEDVPEHLMSHFLSYIVHLIVLMAPYFIYSEAAQIGHNLAADISIFIVATISQQIACYYVGTRLRSKKWRIARVVSLLGTITMIVLVVVWTYIPGEGLVFEDPEHRFPHAGGHDH